MTSADQTSTDSSGQPSFIGFEYQILVTVWLALEFIVQRGAPEILVEPPSQEDVAAELRGEEPPTHVFTQSFQIQIKLLSNDLWSAAGLTTLVAERIKKGKPGPAPRRRAFQYLADNPAEHYLLVTTAGVGKELNPHCIKEIGEASSADGLKGLPGTPDIARRIGILPSETPANVRTRIELLLQNHCQVPGEEIDDCIKKLEEAVRERLAGRKPTAFTRAELESLLSGSRGELLSEVKPTYPENFEKIRERLAKDHVAIVIGPPGTGKSTLARLLVDEHRLGTPPAKLHVIKEPEDLKPVHESINAPYSHVFFVEDPWGQGKPNDKSRFFTSELAPLLKKARAGKTFIVVSRLAPYRESVEDSPDYSKWAIELDEKSYSPAAYLEIYERQLADWDQDARANALAIADAALKHLLTPYAVTFFCGELRNLAHKGWVSENEAIKRAKESNVHVFGKRLRERIVDAGRTEIVPAIAIWAELTANGDFISQQNARQLRRLLKDGHLTDVPDVELFFNFLTKCRWLQQREGGFVVTPSVKEALLSLSCHRADFEDTMEALIRSWSARKEFRSILLCLREARWDEPLVSEDAAPPFDSYLISLAAAADSRNFIYVFRELADYSTTAAPAAILARLLRTRREGSGHLFRPNDFPKWPVPADLPPETVAEIAKSQDCAVCAEKFIVDHLSDGMCHHFFSETYPREDLLGFLQQFGWPLIEWFETAVSDVLKYPSESASYLCECLLDLAPSKVDSLIYDAAIALKNCQSVPDSAAAESWRQYSEGETDAWRHGPDDGDERPYLVRQALASAIRRKSATEGHAWIIGHPHEPELLDAWTRLVNAKSDLVVRQIFVALCDKYGEVVPAAEIIYPNPDPVFHPWAVKTLLATDIKINDATKWVLRAFANSREFLELLQAESGQRFDSAKSLLAFLVLKGDPDPDDETPAVKTADPFAGVETLSALFTEAQKKSLIACRKDMELRTSIASSEIDLDFLSTLAEDWPEVHAIDVLEAIAANGGDPGQLLERFIDSKDDEIRVRAWRLCGSRDRILNEALRDSHYGCRRVALDRLVDHPSPKELSALLARVDDPSAYVRERLAGQIGEHGMRDGIPVLIKLLEDKRDYADQPEDGEERIFTVARTACRSFRSLAPLDGQTIASLRSFLEGCESSSTDPAVHETLFGILEEHPSSKNTEFCSRYLDSIWLESKWDSLGGYGIVTHCIAAVCAQLAHEPALSGSFDFSKLMQISEWKEDESGMLAYGLVALALGHDSVSLDVAPVLASEAFTAQKARLLSCVSKRLRMEMPAGLKNHLSDEHSFMSFLGWANNPEACFSEFASSHSDFRRWLESLEEGNDFQQVLHGAAIRLIASVDPAAECVASS